MPTDQIQSTAYWFSGFAVCACLFVIGYIAYTVWQDRKEDRRIKRYYEGFPKAYRNDRIPTIDRQIIEQGDGNSN